MRSTEDAAGEEQVFDVATIQATIGNLIYPARVPLITARFLRVDAIGRVQIKRPTSERHRVVMPSLFDHVLLPQNVVPFKTTAFSFSRDTTDPLKSKRFSFRKFP